MMSDWDTFWFGVALIGLGMVLLGALVIRASRRR
jgi:hypothetical protein